jgi:hypothetical protein
MDLLIWGVAIALIGLLAYTIYNEPPSSGCLSADAARALDEKKKAGGGQRRPPRPVAEAPAAPAIAETAPVVVTETPGVDDQDPPLMIAQPNQLRNPATGETAPVPNNYRFAKKWIKEALVTEGLLERVYAINELDAAVSERVKAALLEFRQLVKYHA